MIMSIKMNNMDDDEEGCYNTNKAHSSFSATLLEAIYRSIDEEELMFRAVDFSSSSSSSVSRSHTKNNNYKKPGGGASRSSSSKTEEIEKWMEKRTASTGFHDHYHYPRTAPPGVVNKKISSCPKVVMSSRSGHHGCSQLDKQHQTLNVTIPKSKSTNSSGYQMGNPANHKALHGDGGGGAGRSGSHFLKTKSHALRFYRELKKMRQPISPGGRLAALINSLFLTGHSKKDKFVPTEGNEHHMEAAAAQTANGNVNNKSTCSSASSFSRSCLSHKTSSSSSASSAHKAARSVRFSSPDNTILVKERKSVRMDENCDDIQALLSKYQNEDLFAIYDKFASEGDDDDDDEISSCGSSDLFELDHLIGPGGMEELPVYETTRLDANRPIANSLFV